MGYRVEYQPIKKVRNLEKRTSCVPAYTALCLLLFFFLVSSCWPEGTELLREILIPGDPETTVMALNAFAQELREGVYFSDALKTFCGQIIGEVQFDPA